MDRSNQENPTSCPPHIAIIGAGITGLSLAAGLHARRIPFTVFERATASHTDIGAGIGISTNAEHAMRLLSPAVHAAYDRIANDNGEDYFQWVDGLHVPGADQGGAVEVFFRLFVGKGCFRGCKRGELLEGLVGCLPAETIKFGKALSGLVEEEGEGTVRKKGVKVLFEDGTEVVADAVIACDGIRSKARELLFGRGSAATYSQKYAFRALVPMADALASLPRPQMAATRFMYNGPGAHIITYPVAGDTLLNTLAVVSDPNPEWLPGNEHDGDGEDGRRGFGRIKRSRNPHIGAAAQGEARRAFERWHPDIQAIATLLPENSTKWAIFDMVDNPVPQYHSHRGGLVCLAGDAAHACGPHLGSGAGFGIEDALLLAELLQAVAGAQAGDVGKSAVNGGDECHDEHSTALRLRLAAALEVFSETRYDRTQWLVKHTRDAVDLFQWRDESLSRSAERFGHEISWRFHKIWDYDVEGMVGDAKEKLEARAL